MREKISITQSVISKLFYGENIQNHIFVPKEEYRTQNAREYTCQKCGYKYIAARSSKRKGKSIGYDILADDTCLKNCDVIIMERVLNNDTNP